MSRATVKKRASARRRKRSTPPTVARLLDDALATLGLRSVRILELRAFADEPATLADLGRQCGVTRERIRQVEARARDIMLTEMADGPLEVTCRKIHKVLGTVHPLEDLLELMPELEDTVEAVGVPAWRVLERLDGTYEISEGWCGSPSLDEAVDATLEQLQEHGDDYGVANIADLDLVKARSKSRRMEMTRQWLADCGFIVENNVVLSKVDNLADYACGVLSLTGDPMSTEEIAEYFDFDGNIRSLKNAMSADERLVRVNRDTWALHDWGLDVYAGIRSVIRRELEDAGGEIDVDELVDRITGKYDVTRNSIMAYAARPPFELRHGVVRPTDETREARKPPERTARMYRRGDAWLYRVRINRDHLRGSSTVAPMGIASLLGMQSGDKVQLDSRVGVQSINWTTPQPTFGTVRRYLVDLDVDTDSEMFFIVNDNREFDVEVVEDMTGDALSDALLLVGAPADLDADSALETFAICLTLPVDTHVDDLIAAFEERGDVEVAELLTKSRDELLPEEEESEDEDEDDEEYDEYEDDEEYDDEDDDEYDDEEYEDDEDAEYDDEEEDEDSEDDEEEDGDDEDEYDDEDYEDDEEYDDAGVAEGDADVTGEADDEDDEYEDRGLAGAEYKSVDVTDGAGRSNSSNRADSDKALVGAPQLV